MVVEGASVYDTAGSIEEILDVILGGGIVGQSRLRWSVLIFIQNAASEMLRHEILSLRYRVYIEAHQVVFE